METNTRGFTIVEAMLFLGISGMMLIGVFAGTSMLITNSRYQDSIFNLESYLQRQSDQAWSGVNSRDVAGGCPSAGSQPPGSSSCLLLGKLVRLNRNTSEIQSYSVVGTEPSVVPADTALETVLLAYAPQTIPASREDYSIPWGSEFRRGQTGAGANVNSILFVRSPISSQLAVYHFYTEANGANPIALDAAAITAAGNAVAAYCVEGGDSTIANRHLAAIVFDKGQGSGVIQARFDASGGTC